MGVAEELGLQEETSELLVLAQRRWGGWVGQRPALAAVAGVPALRGWLGRAGHAEADRVLHALAGLAATDGGDDVAAAGALAWAVLPGACTLAHRLRTLSPQVDHLVAAQLWVEARTFPWRRLRKVAANVLMNTRAGVLRECGARSQLGRTDPTWCNTSLVDPAAPFWAGRVAGQDAPVTSPAVQLGAVLEWACANRVISDTDRRLLLCLVSAADRAGTRRVGRGHGGLMANDVSAAVAEGWGVSARTVRRRASRSLHALAAACVTPGTPGSPAAGTAPTGVGTTPAGSPVAHRCRRR
jgi:hypothetical protein